MAAFSRWGRIIALYRRVKLVLARAQNNILIIPSSLLALFILIEI